MTIQNLLLLLSLFVNCTLYSQELYSGQNILSNNDGIRLEMEICDGGDSICSFRIKEGDKILASGNSGEYFRVNMNGMEDDYDGAEGWYQFESEKGESFELEYAGKGLNFLLICRDWEFNYTLTLKK